MLKKTGVIKIKLRILEIWYKHLKGKNKYFKYNIQDSVFPHLVITKKTEDFKMVQTN